MADVCDMKVKRRDPKVNCSYCHQAPVPAIKQCLLCEASLCKSHIEDHSKLTEYTMTNVRSSPMISRCLKHNRDLSLYCSKCKRCLCSSCRCQKRFAAFHKLFKLDDAQKLKKQNLYGILRRLKAKMETISHDMDRLEFSKDKLKQKMRYIISLVNTDDPLTILKEQESEQSDFCDVQDIEERITKLQVEHSQRVKSVIQWILAIVLLFYMIKWHGRSG